MSPSGPFGRELLFLHERCESCHGPEKQNGDQRFDHLPDTLDSPAILQTYQDILDTLNLGEMPPEEEPAIPLQELTAFIDELSETIASAKKAFLDQGTDAPIRYLNKRELQLTYRDLLGVRLDLDEMPSTAGTSKFDTIAQDQYFTELHWETAFAVAKDALTTAIRNETGHTLFQKRNEIEESTRAHWQHVLSTYPGDVIRFRELAQQEVRLSEKERSKNISEQRQQAIDEAKRNMADPLFATGAVFKDGSPLLMELLGINIYHFPKFKAGQYRVRIRCGTLHDTKEQQTFIRTAPFITLDNPLGQPYQTYYQEVLAPHDNPETLTFTFDLTPDHPFLRNLYFDTDKALWIDWVEMEGPIVPDYAARQEVRLLRDFKNWDVDRALRIIAAFATKAHRARPANDQWLGEIRNYLLAQKASGEDPQATLVDVMAMMLASPQFLYVVPAVSEPGKQMLDPLSVVTKLSYFLWSTMPDTELVDLASTKSLERDALVRQCDRMLDSHKSRQFINAFTYQWLEMARFQESTPNRHVQKTVFNNDWDRYAFSMTREPMELFAHLVANNLPITDFLVSDYCIIDDTLAKYYELPISKAGGYTIRQLPASHPRGGVTGHAAYLMLTSSGPRTSPVERGVFLLRNLLYSPPPPAPPNVPILGGSLHQVRIDRTRNKELSLTRLATERHRNQAQCLSCHRNFDPLGFALEGYDSLGRWCGEHSDGNSRLPSGTALNTVAELKTHLNHEREQFVKGFIKSLLSYASHRPLTIVEQAEIDRIYNQLRPSGFRSRDLIKAVVLSKVFRST